MSTFAGFTSLSLLSKIPVVPIISLIAGILMGMTLKSCEIDDLEKEIVDLENRNLKQKEEIQNFKVQFSNAISAQVRTALQARREAQSKVDLIQEKIAQLQDAEPEKIFIETTVEDCPAIGRLHEIINESLGIMP